jgi:lysyl-tRNA synthetase class 1
VPAPLPTLDPAFFDAARTAKAWPFEEARKLVARVEKRGLTEVLFETCYGPSCLTNTATFG